MARAMKDSGVAWIGKIPHGWEVRTLKSVASVNDDVLNENIAADLIIEYVDIGSVSFDKGIEVTQIVEFGNAPSRARRLVKHGDIILSTVRTYLRAIAPIIQPSSNLVVSTGFAVIRPRKNIVFAFIKYSLQDDIFMNEVAARSTGVSYPAINANELMAIQVVIPPIPEQRAIAKYLDRQTVLIDQRLSTLEEKKSVLAELRKATIHEAVTKGLNKNALMKDSGVALVGLVPSHWSAVRFKDVAQLNPSTSLPKLDEIDFFPMEAIGVDGGLTFGQRKPVSQSSGYSQMKNGDVCFAKVTPCFENGKSAIVEGLEFGVALATTEITILRPNKKINRHFLHYRIKGLDFAAGGANEMKGAGGLKRVPERFAAEFVFQLPPLSEQLAIANHLDQQTQQIDAQLATLDEQVRVLKELRKAIIHEAVTGKIDLSGAVSGKENR